MGNPIASGLMCLGPSFFVSAAWILSMVASVRCNFYFIEDNSDYGVLVPRPKQIGLWCYEDQYGNNWDARNITFDSMYESARGLGTAVMCLGLVMWIFYLCAGCRAMPPVAFKFIGLLAVVNCILQSCVFLLNKSNACRGGCKIAVGGNCAIAAAVLWFVGGLLSCASGNDAPGGDEVGEDAEAEQSGLADKEAAAAEVGVEEAK